MYEHFMGMGCCVQLMEMQFLGVWCINLFCTYACHLADYFIIKF